MTSITELANYFKVDSKEFKSLLHNLIVDNVPFDSQEVDTLLNTIVTNINSHLNQAATRCNGLLLLDKISDRCSKDVFSKYGLLWIINAIQVLENVHSNVYNVTLACKVLGSLIKYCKEIPELNKHISTNSVKQLVNIISASNIHTECEAIYYLIAVLLYHYPEVCEKFQVSIKKIILSQIDSTQQNLVDASAKCYILLCKATERSFKPLPEKSMYTGWMYSEALLCNSLHTIMDVLFSELIELESIDIWDQLELPSISEKDIVQYYNRYEQRFSNLCIYLSSMLRGYQVKNSVLPDDILKVLSRGLVITPLNLKDTTFKQQMLYIILPKLHISLLSVMDAFINGFARELIPFGKKILSLFQQTLQWTSIVLDNQVTINNAKPFKGIKICIYKCLSSYLMNASSLSGIETVTNECITYILKDIIPEQDRILLTVQQKPQHLSKRAMKRFKGSQYENSPVLNNHQAASSKNASLDADLCKEALVVLQNILSSGVLLKQTLYKNIQNSVIPLLYDLYLSSSNQKFYKTHSECRLELFKVLKTLQMNPHITLAFPMQYCLKISHLAACDIDLGIAQEAKLALAELEKITHPAAPTLRLSKQQRPDDDEFVAEDEAEEIVNTSKSSKRDRTVEEFSEHADVMSSTYKRLRKTVECTETVQIEKSSEAVRMNDSIVDADKSQVDNARVNVRTSKEHETIDALQEQERMHCDSVVDADKSQADDGCVNNVKTSKEQEAANVSREEERMHCDEENQSNVDEITDITVESRTECKLNEHVDTEEQRHDEHPKDLASCINEIDETVQRNLDIIIEEEEEGEEEKLLQDNTEEQNKNTEKIDYKFLFHHNDTIIDDIDD